MAGTGSQSPHASSVAMAYGTGVSHVMANITSKPMSSPSIGSSHGSTIHNTTSGITSKSTASTSGAKSGTSVVAQISHSNTSTQIGNAGTHAPLHSNTSTQFGISGTHTPATLPPFVPFHKAAVPQILPNAMDSMALPPAISPVNSIASSSIAAIANATIPSAKNGSQSTQEIVTTEM